MSDSRIVLNKGREKSVLLRNQWLFSGAIARAEAADGAIAAVYSAGGEFLGSAYYNAKSQIAARMLSFGEPYTRDLLACKIRRALDLRSLCGVTRVTDAYRMLFSEGDFLPGIIVDSYAGHLSVQSLTLGADGILDDVLAILTDLLHPQSIYEKSDHAGRTGEGAHERIRQIAGQTPDSVVVTEHGVRIVVDIRNGQKTGFFIDQRDNRNLIRAHAGSRRVLNLFSYSGGFSLAALAGGASEAVSVDISAEALALADRSAAENGFAGRHTAVRADVFEYIRTGDVNHDVIIVDPPAFIKSRGALERGLRGYKDVNLNVFKRCPASCLVLTCSCSRFMDPDLFQKVVFGAAHDAKRNVRILGRFSHPADHPVNLANPETEYLKALLLAVE